MYFVYILRSLKDKSYYVGTTEDLPKRIGEHNNGSTRYSSTKRPYELIWHCVFGNKTKAWQFEKYLKSGSGFAFRNKRLI